MRRILCIILLILSTFGGYAIDGAAVQTKLTALVKANHCEKAQLGITMYSETKNERVFALNADQGYIPASLLKIVTTKLALKNLGTEYRFTTRLLAAGNITPEGVLEGNLIMQGGGDPLLNTADIINLVAALPVKRITGKLLLDSSFFPAEIPARPPSWEADDLPWYYAAPVDAVSCAGDVITVNVTGTRAKRAAQVTLQPMTYLFTIENNATTGAGAVSVTVADNVIKVSGSVAAGQTANQRICTPVPGSLAQEALLYAVQLRGIVVAGGEVNPTPVKEIAKHESVPLREIITPMLKESDNHIAEQLRATMLARCRTELPLRFRSWALLTGATEPPATPDNTRQWVDGSGLSRENSFSPARLEEYLLAAENKQLLRDALPVAGLDGTLATRMADTCAQGVVCAKTGTMTGVCNIAGVTKTKSGETIVFVIMASSYAGTSAPVKKMQDALLVWLTEQ